MKKNRLQKKLNKTIKALKDAEKQVSQLQNDRAIVMKKMVETDMFTVKEVSELASMTRQMVYKIVGKKVTMSDISVNEASTNVLLAELESRGIISIARKLDTYLPTEKEKVIATGVAYNMDNPRQVLAEVLSYQYAYERIALETLDIYKNDEEQYEDWFKGEGTI